MSFHRKQIAIHCLVWQEYGEAWYGWKPDAELKARLMAVLTEPDPQPCTPPAEPNARCLSEPRRAYQSKSQ